MPSRNRYNLDWAIHPTTNEVLRHKTSQVPLVVGDQAAGSTSGTTYTLGRKLRSSGKFFRFEASSVLTPSGGSPGSILTGRLLMSAEDIKKRNLAYASYLSRRIPSNETSHKPI